MKLRSILFTATLLFMSFNIFAQSTSILREFKKDTLMVITKTLASPDGSIIAVGHTLINKVPNVIAFKTNALGKVTWKTAYPSKDSMMPEDAALSRTGHIMIGGILDKTDKSKRLFGFMLAISSTGAVRWCKEVGSANVYDAGIYGVTVTIRGEYIGTGYIDQDSLGNDLLLTKFDSTGTLIWSKTVGDLGDQIGKAVREESNGSLLFTGIHKKDTNSTTNQVHSDILVLKTTSVGNIDYFKSYSTRFDEGGKDLIITRDNKYLILAEGQDTNTFVKGMVALKLNRDFTQDYAQLITSNFEIKPTSLWTNNSGDYIYSGVMQFGPNYIGMALRTSSTGGQPQGFSDIFKTVDNPYPHSTAFTVDGGFVSMLAQGTTSTTGLRWNMIRGAGNFTSTCGFSGENLTTNSVVFDESNLFNSKNNGFINNISLSGVNLSLKDTMKCCKLSALVIADTVNICENGTTALGAAALGGYIYKWSQINGTFTSTASNPSVSPAGNAQYKLVVSSTESACLADSATVFVRVSTKRTDLTFPDKLFCDGDSVTYEFKGLLQNFSWSYDGNVSTLNPKTFANSHTVYFSGIESNGCSYKDTFTTTKVALPTFNLGADTTICDNIVINLQGPLSMANYNWNGVNSSSNVLVTGDQKLHTLIVTDSNGCKAQSTKRILHKPSSPIVLGPDTAYCAGKSFTLRGPLALFNFKWNNVPSNDKILTVTKPGIYTVEAENSFGCVSYDTITISEWNLPVFDLGADIAFCQGKAQTVSGPDGYSYAWSNGDDQKLTQVSTAGFLYLTVTDNNKCSFKDSLNVTVNPLPVFTLGKDTAVNKGSSITLGPDGNFVSYKWSTGETTKTITKTIDALTTFSLTVADGLGCENMDEITVDIKLSVNELVNQLGLKVYPNPFASSITVSLNTKNFNYVLYSLDGRELLKNEVSGNSATIDANELSPGVYMLKVEKDNLQHTFRLMKE